jgi:hypothetical protein
MVDPLGEVLMKLLPDGFRVLFAPAAALPAPVLIPPLVEFPVVVPGVVVPLIDDPVVVPLVADPPADVPPLVEPVPVCASANELANVSAATNPRLLSFMVFFPLADKGKNDCASICSAIDFNWV